MKKCFICLINGVLRIKKWIINNVKTIRSKILI